MARFDPYPKEEPDICRLVSECYEIADEQEIPLRYYDDDKIEVIDASDYPAWLKLVCHCQDFRIMMIEELREFRDIDTKEERLALVKRCWDRWDSGVPLFKKYDEKLGRNILVEGKGD